MPAAPGNRYLATFRGHRQRSWGDAEMETFLLAISEGHSMRGAADLAGIPLSTVYWHVNRDPELAQAIGELRTQEGGDWWEERLWEGMQGKLDKRAAQYVRMALELRGRLGRQVASGPAVQVNIGIYAGDASAAPPLTARVIEQEPAPDDNEPAPGT